MQPRSGSEIEVLINNVRVAILVEQEYWEIEAAAYRDPRYYLEMLLHLFVKSALNVLYTIIGLPAALFWLIALGLAWVGNASPPVLSVGPSLESPVLGPEIKPMPNINPTSNASTGIDALGNAAEVVLLFGVSLSAVVVLCTVLTGLPEAHDHEMERRLRSELGINRDGRISLRRRAIVSST